MENFSEKLNKTKTAIKKFPRFAQLHIYNIPGYVCLVYLVFSFLIRCCVCLAYLELISQFVVIIYKYCIMQYSVKLL